MSKKEWWVVFEGPDGKELAAYTAAHTFPGEAADTVAILANENGLEPEEIKITTVYR